MYPVIPERQLLVLTLNRVSERLKLSFSEVTVGCQTLYFVRKCESFANQNCCLSDKHSWELLAVFLIGLQVFFPVCKDLLLS